MIVNANTIHQRPNHVDVNSTDHHVEIINEKTLHQKLLHYVHDEIQLSSNEVIMA